MTRYTDVVFAPIDYDLALERVAGGNETEVYRSDDGRYVAKLKHELGGSRDAALAQARQMRDAAEAFASCLGPGYAIPSYYLLARESSGRVQILVLQPFLRDARALADLDYRSMTPEERRWLGRHLLTIIRRAEAMYRETGSMPDLYGRTSASKEERRRNRSPLNLPRRLWSFLVERTLLRSHNLMRTGDLARPVTLVDYDFVRQGRLYRRVYFLVRKLLFYRDRIAIRAVLGL
ncbi:MAG: hypothetical protein HGA45_25145 [Chloroflexales bacterium]|nr:hypothetical protein [Chloroflexales bacterium]